MSQMRVSAAASLMGVSDDTIRRWVDRGQIEATTDDAGRVMVDGASLAALAKENAEKQRFDALDGGAGRRSARTTSPAS